MSLSLKSSFQTALVPDHHIIIRLSNYLAKHKHPSSAHIPFPGTPSPTDLTVLNNAVPATSSGPLSVDDVVVLRSLRADLERICDHAKERGVRIIIDAEHTYVFLSSQRDLRFVLIIA